MIIRQDGVYIVRFLTIILISLATLPIISSVCHAEWNRKGQSEVFLIGQSMGGDTTTAQSGGIKAAITLDGTTAFGFGFGQNWGDHLNGNMEMFVGSMDVTGKALGITVKGDATLFGTNLNLNLNILKSRFAPLVAAGIGLIRFTGDIEGWPFDETDLSYNIGAGFRWDIGDHFLIKLIYRTTGTKLEETDKSIRFDGAFLSIGSAF